MPWPPSPRRVRNALTLLALCQDLRDVLVAIGHWRLSATEIDQHLAARLQRLLDFLLGSRLIENLGGIIRIAHRGAKRSQR